MANRTCTLEHAASTIRYELQLADRRTLSIAVYPDKRVVVKAPQDKPLPAIYERVQRRARWITRQLDYFSQFDPRTPPRRYVSGESHRYLGRQYSLKVLNASRHEVSLRGGRLHLTCSSAHPDCVRRTLIKWYRDRAWQVMPEMLNELWQAFDWGTHAKPTISIRRMKTRWGSLSSKGRMTLNLHLMQAPRSCIEYVIAHELCHLNHPYHNTGFYRQLKRAMPDWERRQHRLNHSTA